MRIYSAIGNLTVGAASDQRSFEEFAMRAYLSQGDWRWPDTRRIVPAAGYPHVLISFVYDEQRNFFSERLGYWPDSILGDSGAFTVWTRGDVIDLEAYVAWCLAYQQDRDDFVAITLDVIPGSPDGGAPTGRERKAAMAEGLENSDAMRAAGVKRLIEVFHWHEPLEHLDLLLERRQEGEIVGIGGLAGGGSRTGKQAFCDQVWRRILDVCGGWDRVPPVHGLGLSPLGPLCNRYPWWSVDSSSWIVPGRFGREILRNGRRGRRDDRVGQRNVRHVYLTRVLDSWQKQEDVLTRLWASRGVKYLP